ncbi:hypothetical protein [Streptomyces sp. NBC_00996]|uniref:hypothetical protein n=1 Tax=Streptomyces sp. NBC_00996 TaxID=2903710 RepID=UPI0038693655|nr:hypothetical protein OG390_34585 [Streptomyces sp. NBC_00996]
MIIIPDDQAALGADTGAGKGSFVQLKKPVLIAGMCASMAVAGLTAAPSAYAEGSGGCYRYSNVDTYPNDSTVMIWQSCISKKATRVGHPYAVVSMGAKHAKCSIVIRVLTTGEKIVSKKTYACPKGKVVNKTYAGNDFHGKGQFITWVQLVPVKTEGNLSPRSPWLNLH